MHLAIKLYWLVNLNWKVKWETSDCPDLWAVLTRLSISLRAWWESNLHESENFWAPHEVDQAIPGIRINLQSRANWEMPQNFNLNEMGVQSVRLWNSMNQFFKLKKMGKKETDWSQILENLNSVWLKPVHWCRTNGLSSILVTQGSKEILGSSPDKFQGLGYFLWNQRGIQGSGLEGLYFW